MVELRQTLRGLLRRPAYASAAVGTLALVIGVNAALFAAINATLFRAIPLRSGDRTVQIYLNPPGQTDPKYRNPLHSIDLVRFRERSRTLENIAAFTTAEHVLGYGAEPAVVATAAVNARLLHLSVDEPLLGRMFSEDEETRQEKLIVLSFGAWQRRFGADSSIVGRVVQLDGDPFTVIGVMPQRFPPPFLDAELWTPLGITTTPQADDGRTNIVTIARLADGVTFEQANADTAAVFQGIARELPRTHQGWTAALVTFRDWQYRGFRAPLGVLLGAMIVLLLIASFNIAGLTLAHVTARGGELALRRALGATRWDVARLVLAETAIINAAGAGLAVVLGAWMLPALLAIAPATTKVLGEVTLDWRVMIYAGACAMLSSTAAGIAPAFGAAAAAGTPQSWIGRSTGTRSRRRLRTALLVVQTALSVALLVAGGLLVRAFVRTGRQPLGYDPTNVLTAQLQLPPSRYANGPERVAAMERIFSRLETIPGVTQAGATMNRFTPGFAYITLVEIEGQPTPDGSGHSVQFRRVSESYFKTMRIRVRAGRIFERTDSLATLPVAVVSQSFADQFWPGIDPIGRRLTRGNAMMTVVGVVDDVTDVDLQQTHEPTLYAAWAQTANVAFPMGLVLRTAGKPEAVAPALRAAVAGVDPLLALDRIQSIETFLGESMAPQRFRTTLMLGLAALGLLLGAIGIAGVTARGIAERMPEFGVRLTLGCKGADLWRQVMADQMRTALVGTALGVGLATAAGRLLSSLLPEAERFDPTVVVVAAALLAASAAAAAAIPASRVLRLNPIAILRDAVC